MRIVSWVARGIRGKAKWGNGQMAIKKIGEARRTLVSIGYLTNVKLEKSNSVSFNPTDASRIR